MRILSRILRRSKSGQLSWSCRGWVEQIEPSKKPGVLPVSLTVEPLSQTLRISLGNLFYPIDTIEPTDLWGGALEIGSFHNLSGRGSNEPFELQYSSIIELKGLIPVEKEVVGDTTVERIREISEPMTGPIPPNERFDIYITYRPPAKEESLIRLHLVADRERGVQDSSLAQRLFNRIAEATCQANLEPELEGKPGKGPIHGPLGACEKCGAAAARGQAVSTYKIYYLKRSYSEETRMARRTTQKNTHHKEVLVNLCDNCILEHTRWLIKIQNRVSLIVAIPMLALLAFASYMEIDSGAGIALPFGIASVFALLYAGAYLYARHRITSVPRQNRGETLAAKIRREECREMGFDFAATPELYSHISDSSS